MLLVQSTFETEEYGDGTIKLINLDRLTSENKIMV